MLSLCHDQQLPVPTGWSSDLDSAEYAAQLNQVKELGSINSTTRTAEQTEIAKFWADGPGTFTPQGTGTRLLNSSP